MTPGLGLARVVEVRRGLLQVRLPKPEPDVRGVTAVRIPAAAGPTRCGPFRRRRRRSKSLDVVFRVVVILVAPAEHSALPISSSYCAN